MQSLYDVTRPNRAVPLPDVQARLEQIRSDASRLAWMLTEANRQQRIARTDIEKAEATRFAALAETQARTWLDQLRKDAT